MNPHVKRFILIFCLIGVAVCAALAVANASSKPASVSGTVFFGAVAVVLAAGALMLRARREA